VFHVQSHNIIVLCRPRVGVRIRVFRVRFRVRVRVKVRVSVNNNNSHAGELTDKYREQNVCVSLPAIVVV